MAVTATEFAKNFGRYKEEAQREPVAITTHGRVSGYFVPAREYQELKRLRELERRVYSLKDLPEDLAAALDNAQMDPAHDHLNALLKE